MAIVSPSSASFGYSCNFKSWNGFEFAKLIAAESSFSCNTFIFSFTHEVCFHPGLKCHCHILHRLSEMWSVNLLGQIWIFKVFWFHFQQNFQLPKFLLLFLFSRWRIDITSYLKIKLKSSKLITIYHIFSDWYSNMDYDTNSIL